MNFLSEEQQAWKDSARRWVDRDVGREYIRKCDMDRAFPFEAYEKAAKLGFHSLLVPEADGGDGGSAGRGIVNPLDGDVVAGAVC